MAFPESLKSIFAGPDGLRSGWRVLVFVTMAVLCLMLVPFIARYVPGLTPPSDLPPGTVTPALLGVGDAILLALVCVITWIMSRIEHRKIGEYGLPLRQALGKRFWQGALIGFLAINGTLLVMYLLGGFRVTGMAIRGATIFSSLLEWVVAFLVVALFEEFAFRGYIQHALTTGIGFWPAACAISGLFGLSHFLADRNENVVGSITVVMFGLLLCLFLRRTGNLWCAVGFHVAYDWGETCFYGVPDSGTLPSHYLLRSVLSGPNWLSGGKVGPEASVLTPIALLVVALIFRHYFRENRYQVSEP